jgi:hypothetical protein
MKGRPDPERILHLKREAHRIRAKYDTDPDNAWYQHCLIRDLMAADFEEDVAADQEEGDASASGST